MFPLDVDFEEIERNTDVNSLLDNVCIVNRIDQCFVVGCPTRGSLWVVPVSSVFIFKHSMLETVLPTRLSELVFWRTSICGHISVALSPTYHCVEQCCLFQGCT